MKCLPIKNIFYSLKNIEKIVEMPLKPFRYDGSLTTHFSYKEYTYVKEIEIATIQNEIYRLSFNAMGIMDDGITIKIYDKPKKYNKRTLLYEKENVTGSEFTLETNEMIDKFKQAKREQGYEEKVVTHLRLKKLFIDYIIPAKERVFETNDEDGTETKVITKGAVILAVGYNNL